MCDETLKRQAEPSLFTAALCVLQPIHRLQVDTDSAEQAGGHLQADPATEAEELQTAPNVARADGEQRQRRK